MRKYLELDHAILLLFIIVIYLLYISRLFVFGDQKVHLWRKYENLYGTSPCGIFFLIDWDANLWIRNKFSFFFEKCRMKYEESINANS